ncbi:MAG: hypothetical protein QXW78_02775 [Candidatus Thermoplasmatota archaeon]
MKKIALPVIALIFCPASFAFPEKFSWRDIDGVDYTTPVKNQEYKVGPFGCDLSEAHLFFCSGGTCKWGVNVTNAANYVVNYGVQIGIRFVGFTYVEANVTNAEKVESIIDVFVI